MSTSFASLFGGEEYPADVEENAHVAAFKALSDPNRIRIISLLLAGDQFVTDLVKHLNICQPTVSHHVRILRQAGLIRAQKDGVYVALEVNVDRFRDLVASITPPPPPRRTRRK